MNRHLYVIAAVACIGLLWFFLTLVYSKRYNDFVEGKADLNWYDYGGRNGSLSSFLSSFLALDLTQSQKVNDTALSSFSLEDPAGIEHSSSVIKEKKRVPSRFDLALLELFKKNASKYIAYRSKIARETETEIRCSFGKSGRWIKFNHRPLNSTLRRDIVLHQKCPSFEEPSPGIWYGWVPPKTCPIKSVNECRNPQSDRCVFQAVKVCKAMKGRDMLMLGDSTVFTSHDSLILLMSEMRPVKPILNLRVPFIPDKPANGLCKPYHSHSKMRYVRNDHLVYTSEDLAAIRLKNNAMAYPFTQYLANDSFIFMNRGVHFEPTNSVISALRKLLGYLRLVVPFAVIIYQHTPIPVHQSLHSKIPAETPIPLRIEVDWYGWQNISQQNIDVEKFLMSEFPEVTNISPEYMLSFRGDNRKDPVHGCIPGWADWLTAQIAHTIIKINSLEGAYEP